MKKRYLMSFIVIFALIIFVLILFYPGKYNDFSYCLTGAFLDDRPSESDINKFQKINYRIGVTKTPIVLDYTLAYIEAAITEKIDVLTHTIFIGKVMDADILTDEKPMTYEYYHQVKGGISPQNAPTYVNELDPKRKEDKKDMEKYKCSVCGYIYDPEKGDPDGGIKPGTGFEDLPEDWTCPVCGAAKDAFEKV